MSEDMILALVVGCAALFFGGSLVIGMAFPETHWLNCLLDGDWSGAEEDGDACGGDGGGD